jgi:uncharacterized repeat protein (TIGR01451 family)
MRGLPIGRIGIALVVSIGIVALLPGGAFAQTADLSIDKTDSADPVTVGTQFTYSIAVSNAGPDQATGVSVEDTLPNEVDFVSAAPASAYSEGSCDLQGSKKVTCGLGALPSGGSASVTITVRAQREGQAANKASVSGTPNDPAKANNDDTEQTLIQSAPAATCAGVAVTISGSSGPDALIGTNKRDVIAGFDGDDVIKGLDGSDVICGGPGSDALRGKADGDVIKGGRGDDRGRGGEGDDSVAGNAANDNLGGGLGDDALKGGRGTDRCRGGPGRDTRRGCE